MTPAKWVRQPGDAEPIDIADYVDVIQALAVAIEALEIIRNEIKIRGVKTGTANSIDTICRLRLAEIERMGDK